MDLGAKVIVVFCLFPAFLLGKVVLLAFNPFSAHLLNLLVVVQLGVVALVLAAHALPPGEMLPVDGNAVVVVLPAGTNALPAALLLLEVKAGCIRKEDPGQQGTDETEPGNEVELGLGVDVVVQDRSEQSSSLTGSSREAVGSGTDGCGEHLSSDQERDGVGAELVEERRQEVHGLECVNMLGLREVLKVESRHNEENEIGHETDNHHPLASIELVVDQNRRKVVSAERDTNVDQVVEPTNHDRVVARSDDLDELRLEEFIAVEEDVVGKPGTGSSDQTGPEVAECQLQGSNVVSGNVCLLLSELELLGRRLHLEVAEVDEPKSANGGNGERDTIGPLGDFLRVGRCRSRVEDQKQKNQDDLVEKLAPTLHEESTSDLATTVQTVLLC